MGALPWNRREEIELGKGTPLPSDVPPVTPEQIQKSSAVEENIPGDRNQESSPTPTQATADTPTQESSPTPTQATADTPTQESSPTPTQATADTPTQESSPTPTGGGAIATFAPLAENEARQLVNDLPEVLSTYQGSTTKTLDSSYLPGDSALQPAKLLASLVIDQNGTFQQAKVLEIAPASLQAEKSFYEQIISELFRNENFSPGHNRDGTKPDLSNLFVRITIEPTNQ
ncbi:hypothetical protein FD725_25120 [Nostoc sp. TCL26-01]|nr:hypothetical protein FD725_25120 [Nostoc sp. TCL26-01]